MYIVDLSQEIFEELNEDSFISIPSISFWLRSDTNVGKLNDLINTTFITDPASLEVIDATTLNTIGILEAAVYAQMYYVSFYAKKAQSFLGAAGIDNVITMQSDQGQITFINRNEIAKTFLQMKKDAQLLLNQLVNKYKFYSTRPVQVIGDDLIEPQPPLFYARRNLLT